MIVELDGVAIQYGKHFAVANFRSEWTDQSLMAITLLGTVLLLAVASRCRTDYDSRSRD